ncbi:hypothetical protein [Pyrobaculum neutrophilum]|uniref:Uncharacterized protein n=1 Tax=Pyrobaculum neutrophilum (strain DSM 2338 / JCM 9278 / NBRC 100436 / V24Sta) TaxID=444157 RepID=B1Y8K7_PYRNV|nr:hypothetical protein [Pyrobaculum neutrophilum]ACB40086.1 hypothetical protein Tneu_1157 [Pyrobaculum neutrophilum V24Sta]
MRLLYLDAFYYYAPVRRVLDLRAVLRERGLVIDRLLHTRFSSATLLRDQINSVLRSDKIGEILTKLFSVVLSGKKRKTILDTENLAVVLDDEKTHLIEFLIFIAKYIDLERQNLNIDELSDTLNRQVCPEGTAISVDKESAMVIRMLREPKYQVLFNTVIGRYLEKIYDSFAIYTTCRVCKLLGLNPPDCLTYAETFREDPAIGGLRWEAWCPQCRNHLDDVAKAEILQQYAISNRGDKIYVATVGTIKPSRSGECFTCLVNHLSSLVNNIEHITHG